MRYTSHSGPWQAKFQTLVLKIGGFMRYQTLVSIESADFAFDSNLCIVISRAQGVPETGALRHGC